MPSSPSRRTTRTRTESRRAFLPSPTDPASADLPGPAETDFFVCDIFDALPKDDMATMEHPVFSLSTRPDLRVLRYARGVVTIEVTPSVRGLATIHDKDILIYCLS